MNTDNAYSVLACTQAHYICLDAQGRVLIRTRHPLPYGAVTIPASAADAFLCELDVARASSNDPYSEARSIDNLCKAELRRNVVREAI